MLVNRCRRRKKDNERTSQRNKKHKKNKTPKKKESVFVLNVLDGMGERRGRIRHFVFNPNSRGSRERE
jgi:hypothetical protein